MRESAMTLSFVFYEVFMNKYIYKGEVINNFGQIIYDEVILETRAVSKKKAISNFKFQIKKKLKLIKTAKVYINNKKVRRDYNE